MSDPQADKESVRSKKMQLPVFPNLSPVSIWDHYGSSSGFTPLIDPVIVIGERLGNYERYGL
jgi:hypothetical protein